jgi:MFS family permease
VIRKPPAILAILTALNFLNYIDRWVLPSVLPLVTTELGLSKTIAGTLGTVFLVGYFATSPLFGALADRERVPGGRKGLLAAGVAVWSAATFASGLARTTAPLIAARAVVGVGEASYGTVAPTIIDDMAPPARKGRWLAIFYLAVPIGSALGFVIGAALSTIGWREAFFIVGGPGLLAALACLAIAEPERLAASREHLREANWRRSFGKLAATPLYRRGVVGYCWQTFAVGGFGFWAPTFLHEAYGLEVKKAGSTFGAILLVAGGLGTWLGGAWTDRWIARANAANDDEHAARIALRVCSITGLVAAPFAAGCFFAPSATLFFALAFVCEAAIFASTSPINAVILRTVPTEARASAMALSIFAIHLFGDLGSPTLLGYAQDVLPTTIAMMGVPITIAVGAVLWWTRVD